MRRFIIGLLLLAACEGSQQSQPPDPCPAQCLVRFSTRQWVTIVSGKVITGFWSYEDHYRCDARCRYSNGRSTCTLVESTSGIAPMLQAEEN